MCPKRKVFMLFAIACMCVQVRCQDVCDVSDTSLVFTYDFALECISQMELAKVDNTIDAITGTLQAYSFRDIAKNSGPPYNISVRVLVCWTLTV